VLQICNVLEFPIKFPTLIRNETNKNEKGYKKFH